MWFCFWPLQLVLARMGGNDERDELGRSNSVLGIDEAHGMDTMIFTNGDLQRLKALAINVVHDGEHVSIAKPNLRALIARLEAAEYVCTTWSMIANTEHPCTMNDALNAWCKMAGK